LACLGTVRADLWKKSKSTGRVNETSCSREDAGDRRVGRAIGGASSSALAQQKTVKIGILHSLSGTMAISETVLKDTVLMAVDEINAKGGVMGAKIEPVVVDPASNWPLFAEKARQLITQDKVAVVFGCWTSVSRKSVLPVFEELNGPALLPGAVRRRGDLQERVLHRRRAQPAGDPAVEYLMSKDGGGAKRWFLLGTDYVYPRTTNKILRAFLKSKGVAEKDIEEVYTPFGHSDYQTIVANIKKFSAGGKTAVVSTINGDSNVPFYKELGNQGPQGDRRAGGGVLGRRGGAARRRHQAARRPPRGLELLHVDQGAGQRRVHEEVGRPMPRRRTSPGTRTSRSPTTRWKRPTSASTCGSRRWRRRSPFDVGQGERRDGRPDLHRALGHHFHDGPEEPPSCTRRCSSAK
jgi:ABC-type branched-subunit amino acid transport system substrate-binding protein